MYILYKHVFLCDIVDLNDESNNRGNNKINERVEIFHRDKYLSIKEVKKIIWDGCVGFVAEVKNVSVIKKPSMVCIDIPKISLNLE